MMSCLQNHLKQERQSSEPEKEQPEKEKSTSKDSTNPDESDDKYHNPFKQQEFEIKLDDFLQPIDSNDDNPQDYYDLVDF